MKSGLSPSSTCIVFYIASKKCGTWWGKVYLGAHWIVAIAYNINKQASNNLFNFLQFIWIIGVTVTYAF